MKQEFTKLLVAGCGFNIQTNTKEEEASVRERHAVIRSMKTDIISCGLIEDNSLLYNLMTFMHVPCLYPEKLLGSTLSFQSFPVLHLIDQQCCGGTSHQQGNNNLVYIYNFYKRKKKNKSRLVTRKQ